MAKPAKIVWAGEELLLLPERLVWWKRERTLFMADPHFGKAHGAGAGRGLEAGGLGRAGAEGKRGDGRKDQAFHRSSSAPQTGELADAGRTKLVYLRYHQAFPGKARSRAPPISLDHGLGGDGTHSSH